MPILAKSTRSNFSVSSASAASPRAATSAMMARTACSTSCAASRLTPRKARKRSAKSALWLSRRSGIAFRHGQKAQKRAGRQRQWVIGCLPSTLSTKWGQKPQNERLRPGTEPRSRQEIDRPRLHRLRLRRLLHRLRSDFFIAGFFIAASWPSSWPCGASPSSAACSRRARCKGRACPRRKHRSTPRRPARQPNLAHVQPS